MNNDETGKLPYTRRYRSTNLRNKTLTDRMPYIGNEQAVKEVTKAMISGERAQSFLLKGPTSSGKTTLARLIGKEYLCDNWTPENGACGVCPNCRDMEDYIVSGKTDDLLIDGMITEINVGVERGVKKFESILEEASYPTLGSEWRVYIFDEFQKASETAQSAMLKMIEEPPEDTLWIFCTTAPEEINSALINRFQRTISVKKHSIDDMVRMMKEIAKLESFSYTEKALRLIGARTDCVPRDALNKLESVVKEHGEVTYEGALDALNEVADEIMFSFFNALREKDTLKYVKILHEIKLKFDISSFVISLEGFVNRGIYIINGIMVEGLSDTELETYKKLFSKFSVVEISYIVSTILDIKNSVSAETKLLRLVYTGVDVNNNVPVVKDTVSQLKSVDFTSELAKEKQMSILSATEKRNVTPEEKKAVLGELTQNATNDDILALFNATSVD